MLYNMPLLFVRCVFCGTYIKRSLSHSPEGDRNTENDEIVKIYMTSFYCL